MQKFQKLQNLILQIFFNAFKFLFILIIKIATNLLFIKIELNLKYQKLIL